MFSKKDLENLAELVRLELSEKEKESLLKDFKKILSHFEELKSVDTEGVPPMSGGTFEKNVFREDGSEDVKLSPEKSVSQFPERDSGFLKIPPVFN
ncbi:MAG: Asp-tRNA(Asn)/Glu-tRNA(Gln) amidotransferase subunit GatC [Candidatus Jorgensenbacteria bacterium]